MGPRIVILDEVELSDDQLRRLEGLGRLVHHTSNPADESEVVRRLDGTEVAIVGWTALGRRILRRLAFGLDSQAPAGTRRRDE